MTNDELDRRDFNKITMAIMSGMMAGTIVGCDDAPKPAPSASKTDEKNTATTSLTAEEQLIIDEPHVCRGLNSCKGLGRSKENDCAGLGTCASMADATCGGSNKCKGQGGCGELPGMNSCEGKGGCHIPLMDGAWEKARAAFEASMTKSGKKFGAAPAKPDA